MQCTVCGKHCVLYLDKMENGVRKKWYRHDDYSIGDDGHEGCVITVT